MFMKKNKKNLQKYFYRAFSTTKTLGIIDCQQQTGRKNSGLELFLHIKTMYMMFDRELYPDPMIFTPKISDKQKWRI